MFCESQAPHPADCCMMIAEASSVVAAAMKGWRHVVASTEGCNMVCVVASHHKFCFGLRCRLRNAN